MKSYNFGEVKTSFNSLSEHSFLKFCSQLEQMFIGFSYFSKSFWVGRLIMQTLKNILPI